MNRIVELMLAIRRNNEVFYHKDTKTFDRCAFSENELKHLSFNTRLKLKDENNIRLPSYKEIDHEEIMRFFVQYNHC